MCDIPTEVHDDEPIVRAICSPHHIKGGKLKISAFKPPKGSKEVSVMRHTYFSANCCKSKGQSLSRSDMEPPKQYVGLAVVAALKVRAFGADVKDSRNVFMGHADIVYLQPAPNGEPLSPEAMLDFNRCLKGICNDARYFPDPDPASAEWEGPLLTAT